MSFRVTSFFLSVPFGLEFKELQYLLCGSPTHITFIQTAEGLFFQKDKNEPEESLVKCDSTTKHIQFSGDEQGTVSSVENSGISARVFPLGLS